jgi:hypothetical protein
LCVWGIKRIKKLKNLKDKGVIKDDKVDRQTANSDEEDIC